MGGLVACGWCMVVGGELRGNGNGNGNNWRQPGRTRTMATGIHNNAIYIHTHAEQFTIAGHGAVGCGKDRGRGRSRRQGQELVFWFTPRALLRHRRTKNGAKLCM